MGQYAEQIVTSKLFKQFDLLVGYEDIADADVAILKQLVLDTADFVGPHLDHIRVTFRQYTEHDLRHLCNIADLIYRFLPKQQCSAQTSSAPVEAIRLNALELAFLWLAILLHDAGMFVSDTEKEESLQSEDYLYYLRHCQERVTAAHKAREQGLEVKARTIEDALLAEYFRKLHPERVRPFITEKLIRTTPLKFRDVSLINDIAELCESHAWGVRESNTPRDPNKCVARMEPNRRIKSFRVNLRYLACCLRLGDVLDFDRSRTPLPVYEEIDFTEEVSFNEWNKHLSIEGWNVDEHRVLFEARCTHPAYYVAVHDFLNWVDEELRECRYLLDDAPSVDEEKYSLNLAHAADRRQVRMSDSRYVAGGFRFQLEYEEIMRLLMDKSLYPDSTLFLRELLQNALDACRYQEALAKDADMEDKYKPRIMVWDFSEDPVSPRVVFQDNGIGMSQRHVENFFLRVGKSFYRSPEFVAERQRLASHNIHLDACSQFGIGFLSCFLGGDTIEVETWRHGNAPLKITITGPSKYFLVERLPEPTDVIPFKSPSNELDDGPPRFPGTRVTVYLKNGWHTSADKPERGIVYQMLDTFAVNQEYDVLIYCGNTDKPEVIECRRWEKAEPLFCSEPSLEEMTILPFLAPLVFNLQDYSDELRGQGALWMLKDPDGKPTPECGLLSVTQRGNMSYIAVRINSEILDLFFKICCLVEESDITHNKKEIIDFVINNMLNDSLFNTDQLVDKLCLEADLILGIEDFIHRNENYFTELNSKDRALLSRFCTIISQQPDIDISKFSWLSKSSLVSLLASGDMSGLIDFMRKHGIPDLDDSLSIEQCILLGLFGINVPGVVVDWNPAKGVANQRKILPDSVYMRVDAYGTLAPKPSSSRLFVHEEHSAALRDAIGQIFLRFVKTNLLDRQEDPAWKRWCQTLLEGCEPFSNVIWDEIAKLNVSIDFQGCINGLRKTLTFMETIQYFGASAPIIDEYAYDEKGKTVGLNLAEEGLLGLENMTWLMEHLPRITMPDGREALDLRAIQAKLEL